MGMKPIAHVYNNFPEKFGLPRQSQLAPHLVSEIVMEEPYRVPEAFRGIEEYGYLWIIWEFEKTGNSEFSPTVRPPRFGGNKRVGVFATRSPNRPNPIGLTAVKLLGVDYTADRGPVLRVAGADIRSGTPVYDIKPYLPYADSYEDAACALEAPPSLQVVWEAECPSSLSREERMELEEAISFDTRPAYRKEEKSSFGMSYGRYQVKFRVEEDTVYIESVIPQK